MTSTTKQFGDKSKSSKRSNNNNSNNNNNTTTTTANNNKTTNNNNTNNKSILKNNNKSNSTTTSPNTTPPTASPILQSSQSQNSINSNNNNVQPPPSPSKITNSNSFLYWKQKDISSQISYPSSPTLLSSNSSNFDETLSTSSTSSSPTLTHTNSKDSLTKATAKRSIFSLGKKSGSEIISSSPTKDSKSLNSNFEDIDDQQHHQNTTSSKSSINLTTSQTLPNRMKSERKSLKNPLSIFSMDFWSNNKLNEQEGTDILPSPPQTPTSNPVNNNINNNNNNNTNSIGNPYPKPLPTTPSSKASTLNKNNQTTTTTTTTTPTNNINTSSNIKPTSLITPTKKLPNVNNNGNSSSGVTTPPPPSAPIQKTPRKTSQPSPPQPPQNKSQTTTPSVTSPRITSPNSSTAPPSPTLSHNSSLTPPPTSAHSHDGSHESSPSSQSSSLSNSGSDPFKNDVMLADDLNLAKLKSRIKSRTEVERLLQLELFTRILSKDLDDLQSKLVNESMLRKEVESYYEELEARLKINEARWSRYSDIQTRESLSSSSSSTSLQSALLQSPTPTPSPSPLSPTLSNNTNVTTISTGPATNNVVLSPPPLSLESNIVNNQQQSPELRAVLEALEKMRIEKEEFNELQKLKEARDEQKINTLVVKIEQLEKKVQTLEQTNIKLLEDMHTLQSENELIHSEKKKKVIKKWEKEKEKELQKEKEREKEREKELQKEALKEKEREKLRLKELAKQQQKDKNSTNTNNNNNVTNNNSKESYVNDKDTTYDTTSMISDTESVTSLASTNLESSNEFSEKKSSLKKRSNQDLSTTLSSNPGLGTDSSPKKAVAFSSDVDEASTTHASHHQKFKTHGYLSSAVTLKRWTGKRLSAHISSTPSFIDPLADDVSHVSTDSAVEKSKIVKGYFNELYDGDIEEMKLQKLTRMRSKSLTKEHDEDEIVPLPQKITFHSTPSLANALNAASESAPPVPPKEHPTSLTSSFDSTNTNEKKRYLTIGRIFKKDTDRENISALLTEKLNHRVSKNELIYKNIIKGESIFGSALTEDTSDRLLSYLTTSIEYLQNYSHLEDLFTKPVDEILMKGLIDSIESSIISEFSGKDPYLVASTFIHYFTRLPTPLLSKISPQMIYAADINDSAYRTSMLRSLIYSLPLQNRNILLLVLQFMKAVTNPKQEQVEHNEEGVVAVVGDSPSKESVTFIRLDSLCKVFTRGLMVATVVQTELANLALQYLVEDVDGFESTPQDIQFMMKEGEPVVKAASFDKLFEKLIDLSYRDTDYNYTVFYTYDYYFKSHDFLDKIIHYYRITNELPAKLKNELSIAILSVAMFWMKIHQNNLSSDLMFLSKLKAFMESVPTVPPGQNTFFVYFKTFFQSTAPIKTLYERGNSFYSKKKKTHPTIGGSQTSVVDKIKDFKDIDIYHLGAPIIAAQMAIIDNELLLLIPPFQFLHKAFTKYDTSPQFHDMVSKFNEWARWTSSEILSKEKLQDRVNSLAFFIDLAKCSVELGNYNSAAAIVGGLNHSSISRLKQTWEKLPTKVVQDYERLETLFDMSMNYKNYREELKTVKIKIIPYLGLFPKDLIAIEEGNDNFTSNGLINIEKFRLLYGMIKKIQTYQQPLFNTKVSEPIKAYLSQISNHFLEEKELHFKSKSIEPNLSKQ
eukprot:gene833-1040_t